MGNEMNIVLWGGVGVAVAFILLIVYLYLKESESNRRTRRYEKSIEELNKEAYRLQKRIKEQESELERFKVSIKAQIYQDTRLEMKNLLDTNLNAQVAPLRNDMESLKSQWQETKSVLENVGHLENKIFALEDRVKEFAYTPTSSTNIDEGRIISMFKDGWSVDSIAKELRIGKGEVEFTLKFANLS
ncbi:DUF6115 domain-containing protein [Helicobacter turcicus]|uniref:Inner membrane protein n=1 Tax=Helicobacter turcicus TaxID=2867412 RepID=A0ABS7JPR3_9HELI|nr:hypothetical protein [Helicobacter turcicus]MBX7491399.1 hypothetical protein [Helicobacter turcicus]MBX7546266.1 hypothetical protein [Helicobacter turcicus]